ncbi:cupin domain-containing protein [Cryobacterium sp. TMT2-10]|uniref:cupin domain-containing protein n=1 Tax=Cryobacterium sp. TMT2-10 TaxID=1259244 RepID=UPI00106C1F7A|nr:cupin domain-containing protein [Cryobacterium sp. TMT2-10]TFD40854.1 cupin domain-containing protein [Cryobacterium sp. TMT2-10]
MKGFVQDIKDLAGQNSDFRRVLYTGSGLQLVVMSLKPGEDIGEEVHDDRDQFFLVEKGRGEIWIDGITTEIRRSMGMVVPAGARHNVLNTGGKKLRLVTVYGPPQHADGTVHATREDAESAEESFDGTTTERARAKGTSAGNKTAGKATAGKTTARKATSRQTTSRKTTAGKASIGKTSADTE